LIRIKAAAPRLADKGRIQPAPGDDMRLPIALSVFAVLAATPALADWQADLRRQMATQEACNVDYFSHVTERQIGNRVLISAKVHCEDKRTFDADWDDQKRQFKVRRCGEVEAC